MRIEIKCEIEASSKKLRTLDGKIEANTMQPLKSKYWWLFFIRGVLAVLFGIASLLVWPILELGPMWSFFGTYIFIQGALTLMLYLKTKEGKQSLPVLLESVLGISIGVFLVMQTDLGNDVFVVSFVSWGIGTGLCKVVGSVLLYSEQKSYWVLGVTGLLSILFNLMFYVQAELEKGFIVWTLSIYFIVYGVLLTVLGAKLKAWQE
jgi:uncharacterized membrane protein HdeD (DUF308 family)